MYRSLGGAGADVLTIPALFTKSMLKDHLPSHYERSTQLLFDGMRQGTI